ncbi:hypothetical protein PInf_022194 [Phytophthora infestans]|nr:hypothetical protein PInf_022194 [Phytophthora infestans]
MFMEDADHHFSVLTPLSPLSASSPDDLHASPPSFLPAASSAKPQKPKKKRKATYVLRKEEQSALQQEVEQLESQVAVLKSHSLPPEEAAKADPHTHPLYTRIRLTKDWSGKRATLRAIRAEKLRNAYEYIMARSSHSQPEKMQLSDERFESSQGDLCCVRFETIHFRGVESLDQVYNALIFYMTNMEISISERLGHITVRDDYDSIEGTAYNSRIASTEECGVTTEMNAVSFPQLFADNELGLGVPACAIMAGHCVDEDELYPYNYVERMRKDVSGAVLLPASRRKVKHRGDKRIGTATMPGEEETELVVTMRRAAFVKLHKPTLPVSPFALQELYEGIARWGDVMLKTIRNVVYASP